MKDSRINEAVDLLKSKQLKDGCWKLDRDVSNMFVKIEEKVKKANGQHIWRLTLLRNGKKIENKLITKYSLYHFVSRF